MDKRHLNYFLAVVDTGSMTAASKRLGVVQPAVSNAIADLESKLSASLFDRVGRGLILTDSGKKLAEHARHILFSFEQMESEMQALGKQVSGTLSLGVTPSIATLIIPDLVTVCADKWPKLKLKIMENYSGYINSWILEGAVDLGILNEVVTSFGSLDTKPFLKDHVVAISSPDIRLPKRISMEYLLNFPLIMGGKDHGLRDYVSKLSKGAKNRTILEVDSVNAIIQLAKLGKGVGILPHLVVKDYVDRSVINAAVINESNIGRHIVFATQKSRMQTIQVKTVIKEALAVARNIGLTLS